MDRSPGFGSAPADSTRCSHSLSLRLRHRLNLAGQGDSQTHYAKGTQSPPKGLLQFEGAWVQVLFHSPLRGSFHLSLTVLVRYRSAASVQPWRVGPPDSGGVSRVPPYLGYRWDRERASPTGLSPSAAPLSSGSGSRLPFRVPAPQPRRAGPPVWAWVRFRSPLLTESRFLSLPPATEMFHFAGFAPGGLWIHPPAPSEDGGLPHSDTPGSKTACVSPGLFAACRVLRRLPPPRHPPCARASWTPGIASRRQAARNPLPRASRRGAASAPLAVVPAGPRLAAPPGRKFDRFIAFPLLSIRAGPLPPLARNYSLCPSGCQRTARRLSAAGKKAKLVEPKGLEPTTSCLQSRRSTN